MAGSFVSVDVKGLTQVSRAINRLLKQSKDLAPAQREIGEMLVDNTQQRFQDMQAPDGSPWQELDPDTLARKTRTDRILTESGTLADNINYQLESGDLAVGSNMEYAATHQFGREDAGIVARPFLGIAPYEKKDILDILRDHLEG